MVDGPFAHDFGDQVIPKKNMKKFTEEEGKARHIARVMAWQKANPEKFKANTSRYYAKEETKEKQRIAYQLTKERDCAWQRAYYAEHREERLEKQRLADEKRREARRKYQREQYHKKKAELLNIKDPTTLGT